MVAPQLVVFATGYQNRFNHPADRIQQRYVEAGAALFDTADSGMISFYLNSQSVKPVLSQYRVARRRYWY
jgi:competence protein ComEC